MLETQADPDHIQRIETKPHFMSDEKLPAIPQKWYYRMQTFQIPGISIAVANQGWLNWCKRQDELVMTNSDPGCEQTKALAGELIRSVEQEYHWANP